MINLVSCKIPEQAIEILRKAGATYGVVQGPVNQGGLASPLFCIGSGVCTQFLARMFQGTGFTRKTCVKARVMHTIENPFPNYFWKQPVVTSYMEKCKPAIVDTHFCHRGEDYRKRTRIVVWSPSGINPLAPLRRVCPSTEGTQHSVKCVALPPLRLFTWNGTCPEIPQRIRSRFEDGEHHRIWMEKLTAISERFSHLAVTLGSASHSTPGGSTHHGTNPLPRPLVKPDFTADPPAPLDAEVNLPKATDFKEENVIASVPGKRGKPTIHITKSYEVILDTQHMSTVRYPSV